MDGLYGLLHPCRTVPEHPHYKSGVFRSEKCGRDIQYESALELKFVKRLEENKRVLFYWDQPIQVKYRAGRHPHYYTPDYGVYLDTHEIIITEVKCLADMLDYRVQRKIESLMAFCSSRGFGLLLTDGRHTPDKLLKGKINRELEKEIFNALHVGTIRKNQYRDIMTKTNATQNEFYKAVIRHNLKFKPFPFKLEKGNISPVFSQVYFGKQNYEELTAEKFITLFGEHR